MTNRRGFTLIELLVGMVLLSIVGVAIIKVIATSQRVTTAQSERVANQGNVRLSTFVVPAELTQINSTGTTDIVGSLNATSIHYLVPRGMGFLCLANNATTVSVYADATYTGRLPSVGRGDRLYVFSEGPDPTVSTDDSWILTGAVTNVQANGSCTGGVNTYVFTSTAVPTANITLGSPVKVMEEMELGSYVSGGQTWLGIRSVSGGEGQLQPVLGPLKTGGFNLAYEDASGTTTASTTAVRSILMTIVGLTDRSVTTSGTAANRAVVQDSLQTRITLRN